MQPDEFPLFCSVDFRTQVPVAPWDTCEFYVHEITGVITAMTSDTEEVKAGTIKLLKIQAAQAQNDSVDLLEICDAHSDYLVTLYHALFDENGDTKPDLAIEPSWNDLLVLWEFGVPTEFRKAGAAVRAFETAILAFGSMDLIAAAMEGEQHDFVGLDLTVDEWRQLGFKRIAGSQFAFRDNCCVNPYGLGQE
jgi:hypothetical protein